MIKTDLLYELSTTAYPQTSGEPAAKPHDKAQHQKPVRQQEPEVGCDKPEPALPKEEPDLPRAPRPPPSAATTDPRLSEYLTRRQAAEYIRDQLRRPMSFSTASKLAALGEFAPPALWWGAPSTLHAAGSAALG